jgi:hypothetical protein
MKEERLGLIPSLEHHYRAKAAEFKYFHSLLKRVLKENHFSTAMQETYQSVCDELQVRKYAPLGFLQMLEERREVLEENAPTIKPSDVDYFLGSALARFGREFTREDDLTMRAEAISWLGFGSGEPGMIRPKNGGPPVLNYPLCWCPMHGTYKLKEKITSAHVIPASFSSDQLRRLLGKKHTVMAKDNSLPMSKTMETLWDSNAYTIVPEKEYSQDPEEYIMVVLQDDIAESFRKAPDMPSDLIWPDDYQNRRIQFPTEKRPSKTYLFMRHACQLYYLADRGGQGWINSSKRSWKWTAQGGILSRPFIHWLAKQINEPNFAISFNKGLRNVKNPMPMKDFEIAEFAAATFPKTTRALMSNGGALILGAQADYIGTSPSKSAKSTKTKGSKSSNKPSSDQELYDEAGGEVLQPYIAEAEVEDESDSDNNIPMHTDLPELNPGPPEFDLSDHPAAQGDDDDDSDDESDESKRTPGSGRSKQTKKERNRKKYEKRKEKKKKEKQQKPEEHRVIGARVDKK